MGQNDDPLTSFCKGVTGLVDDCAVDLEEVGRMLAELVSRDDWLDPEWAVPDPERYQQHLLYLDPDSRFSVVSFVWSPGQLTPIHDHGVWGAVGVLRGAEFSQHYRLDDDGVPIAEGDPVHLGEGQTELISPEIGDIHKVSNALGGNVSISIHVYGGDIGRHPRHVFTEEGTRKDFISGYSSQPAMLPASGIAN